MEMIALAMREDTNRPIYGAVTMGTIWIFGILDPENRCITRDISSYRLPDDLEELVKILVRILE
jgi:hypothetical protein